MTEHPFYLMWKERLDAELAQEAVRAQRRAERERERTEWYVAWRSYKGRLTEVRAPQRRPPWWNLIGWLLWLIRLHSPGRPN
ncbi:MAG TPA: hypothetical protein VFH24_06140 [Gemmatimonadales bacterium]|nr:hypothetical protein [Gemmatimonadales bacterium]